MKFELDTFNRNVPDEDLIQDVQNVAHKIGRNTVTISEYEQFGSIIRPLYKGVFGHGLPYSKRLD